MDGEKRLVLKFLLMMVVLHRGVSPSDITLIVSEHNRYRGQVKPPAADMLKMGWDEEVAMVAQRWAETCSMTHEPDQKNRAIPGRFYVGQSIAQGYKGWTEVIKAWHDEYAIFKYGDPSMDYPKGFVIGHYTQVVWAKSSLVGCGLAVCSGTKSYVCNYGPGGNVGGTSKPYTSGQKPCQNCPGTCKNNLCDCGHVNCQNDGVFDVSKCRCTCSQTFYKGENCDLHCDGLVEPQGCGRPPFNKAGCNIYSNAPSFCPKLCDICPYADIKNNKAPATSAAPSPATSGLVPADNKKVVPADKKAKSKGNSAAPGPTTSGLVSAGLLLSLAAILLV